MGVTRLGLLGAVVFLGACGPTLQPRIYPMDQVYPEGCPSMAVAADEYVQITVHGSHHAEDHLLVGTAMPDVVARSHEHRAVDRLGQGGAHDAQS